MQTIRGIGILADGRSVSHVTLRREGEALSVERFDISPVRSYGRARLARYSPIALTTDLNSVSATERVAILAFLREFKEVIERPAVHEDSSTRQCDFRTSITATAYLPVSATKARLYVLRLSRDGAVIRKSSRTVMTPRGHVRVLAALIRYRETIDENGETLWGMAQEAVNQEHAAYAVRQGARSARVVFENTNVLLDRSEVGDPRARRDIWTALEARMIDVGRYDVVVVIDLNPKVMAGGRSNPEVPFVYVGNFAHWTGPPSEPHWRLIASTAYHHEMAHIWGWDHDWSACESRESLSPFITAPVLFGWQDTDGDGIAEIDDPTPYGRAVRQ